jgi:hypothetical protein
VTDRHAKKLGSKNCDVFPPHRRRGSAAAETLQLAIIWPKRRCFPSQLEPPDGHRQQSPRRDEKMRACQVFI